VLVNLFLKHGRASPCSGISRSICPRLLDADAQDDGLGRCRFGLIAKPNPWNGGCGEVVGDAGGVKGHAQRAARRPAKAEPAGDKWMGFGSHVKIH